MSVSSTFLEALNFGQAPEREAYLDEVCRHDEKLRRHLESLLEVHESVNDSGLYTPSESSGASHDSELGDRRERFDPQALEFLSPSDHPAALGRVDSYEVLRVIGLGGSSMVLEAFDTRLERIVAIKVLAKRDGLSHKARNRFRRGVLAAARVTHPHVISVLAVGEHNGAPYVVSEFVRGQTLARRIERDETLPVADIVSVAHQIMLGLAEIHGQGLVHRDLKPDNIILKHPDDLVKIADFGIAKGPEESGVTQTGEVHGTPQFMSPEQAEGGKVDHRSDLFSLGAVIYAMAAGHSPFKASTPLASMRRVCDEKPQPVQELNPHTPDWLAKLISRLLQKDPERRPQHIREAIARLEEHHAAHEQPAGSGEPPHKRKRTRLRVLTSLVALVLFSAYALSLPVISGGSRARVAEFIGLNIGGRGVLSIQVDDPTAVIEVVRMSSGPAPAFSMRTIGSYRGLHRPHMFHVRVLKDGKVVFAEHAETTSGKVHELVYSITE